ncbi:MULTISPECIES: RelA/SpoT domain-containing protein [unclassified Bradyrhizobium]|uniref:RelA/SpoT domain-containing protein n=1 Tax=unclassified Bradyrhizobium TaxID=2631580 RepID=UPI00211EA53C|nr:MULTISPECIES: RelA/SpoT domain-containing protein [unclassified Bradyrhizobium]MDD1536083.1 (p)ppGpp synthetase [Bradyrhizobium sp. WBOS8]MDD1585653.1 (p)ppGpp synthetase [Bradyrhizobium sp. WBOS4]UUO49045.1 (p)ppGpp synthetase [Bradyrhizobium sp. WBOS04]UUO62860.1 (p)ppGpp synthetase [Bradyrhizobium sp. WBOS08]
MKAAESLSEAEGALVEELAAHYLANQNLVSMFMKSMLGYIDESRELKKFAHSIRSRMKDPDHLRDKLQRKMIAAKRDGKDFDINKDNLFVRINDLAGIRILHLHTTQIEQINKAIKAIIDEQGIELKEGPSARTWDDEYRSYFKDVGIDTQTSENLYTSVHYVIASKSRTTVTCEIQVRTLMEEVWGEVDHTINYPHKTTSVPCREQIRALARQTSSATRLVDAIFATVDDIEKSKRA